MPVCLLECTPVFCTPVGGGVIVMGADVQAAPKCKTAPGFP